MYVWLELKDLGEGGQHRNVGHLCRRKSLKSWSGQCGT